MSLEEQISLITNKLSWYKLMVNSSYGINNTNLNVHLDSYHKLKLQKRTLLILRTRQQKIEKIINIII